MITRYTITAPAGDLAARFSADVTAGYQPRFNAAPTHLLPLLTQESHAGFSFFYWGAPPSMANKKALAEKIVNTWAETIPEKPVLKKKLRTKRCVIPADSFYGWKKVGKKASIPYRFVLPDKGLFSMAGFWEEYDDEHGEVFHTFSVITTPSSDSVLPITDRMPLILNADTEKNWLTSESEDQILGLLSPFHGMLDHYSVSQRLNAIDRDDPSLTRPTPAADQFGNLSLFD